MNKLVIPKVVVDSIMLYLSNNSEKVTLDVINGAYVVSKSTTLTIILTASESCSVYLYTFNLGDYNKGVDAIELTEGVPYEYEFSSEVDLWIVISDTEI